MHLQNQLMNLYRNLSKPINPIKMTMRAATTGMVAAKTRNLGLKLRASALYSSFSSFPFTQPQPNVEKPPPAEPSSNLFVSGLSKRTTSKGLHDAFAKFGEVVEANVITDRISGFSKGFGFVRYATREDAGAGIKGMDGQFLDGWVIFVEYARPRPPLPKHMNDTPSQGQ